MTTGRINQVTILTERRCNAHRPPPETPHRGGRIVSRSGPAGMPEAQPVGSPGRIAARCPRAIQLPRLISPRDGPPQRRRRAREGHLLPGTCTPRAEGTSHPSRRENGYGLRRSPDGLWTMVAIGQSSTDSSDARGYGPTGLRTSGSPQAPDSPGGRAGGGWRLPHERAFLSRSCSARATDDSARG